MTDKSKDVNGRPYATVREVKAGTVLIPDGGFPCIKQGVDLPVEEDAHGLFVYCQEGKHYIDGQLDGGDVYIGLHLEISRPFAAAAETVDV